MSNTASTYDFHKLTYGIGMAAVSALLALLAWTPARKQSTVGLFAFGVTTLAYGGMMFASSYVEEEHHFWYWAASGWLTYLALKRLAMLSIHAVHSHC